MTQKVIELNKKWRSYYDYKYMVGMDLEQNENFKKSSYKILWRNPCLLHAK